MNRGIQGSKLLSDLYEGRDHNVPVGKNILTNDASRMEKRLLPLTEGSPLTSLHMDQFDVFGSDRDSKAAKRDEDQNNVHFKDRAVLNDGLLVEAAFEGDDGVLNLVRRNGDVVQIKDFLVQSDFGIGATGPMGDRGYDGYNGDDGDDGKDGDIGCEGPPGPLGLIGPPGDDGEDGTRGATGPMGQEGETGLQGFIGDKGRYGHEGARGKAGPDCVGGGQGEAGPAGASLNPSVVISETEPGETAVLWGIP